MDVPASIAAEPTAGRILHAAVKLFAEKGYAATSTREIIAAAKVTQPMLYYYFGNKEGLCRAALDGFVTKLHDELRQMLAGPEPTDGRKFLANVVWEHLRYLTEHEDFARLMHALFFGPEEESKVFDFSKCIDEGMGLLVDIVHRANRRGLIRRGREADFAVALRGQMFIVFVAALREHKPLHRRLAEQIVNDLLDGFSVRPNIKAQVPVRKKARKAVAR